MFASKMRYLGILFIAFLPSIGLIAHGRQQSPTVVQPGAPGAPSHTLPSSTKASKTVVSPADIEFVRGMVMHHQQAVEMTALISSRTNNKQMHDLGKRIGVSQADEIKWMRHWLEARGQVTAMEMPDMHEDHAAMPTMPGMLTAQQMDALRHATGKGFDRLFLAGMVQHHRGALVMVKQLFDSAGAGQDAELFDFATDVDNTQRAEINLMERMLKENQ